MKFLCVCEAGCVRSGALAFALRYNFGQRRVIQVSHSKTEQEDLDMLGAWADYIVIMQPRFADKFERFGEKIRILDVGPDIWKNPLHDDLLEIVSRQVDRWRAKDWKF